jgi:hypothetical protein
MNESNTQSTINTELMLFGSIQYQDFTSNVDHFLNVVAKLESQQKFESFDFSSLFTAM